jgi:hypothetical protein
MLIYLDANIVQYCADYDAFVFGDGVLPSAVRTSLRKELEALRKLVDIELELEQRDIENSWDFAAPNHLMKELFAGKPTENQRNVYSLLLRAWSEFGRDKHDEPDEDKIALIEKSLRSLRLKHAADRWHLAEAIALGATWFLTNDRDIIEKTRPKPAKVGNKTFSIRQNVGILQGVRVARPSECAGSMSFHPVWGLTQQEG